MKNLLFCLFFFGILSSQAQEVPLDFEEIPIENLEPGKCYFSALQEQADTKHLKLERPFILEISPPKYAEIEVTLLLENQKSQLEKDGYIRYQIQKPHMRLIRRKSYPQYDTKNNANAFAYCLAEVPSHWKTIYEKDFKDGKITIFEKKIIEESKGVKIYVDSKPDSLTENQSYLQGGYWSAPKEFVSVCRQGYTIRHIQNKLIELGYDIESNNILNDKTKFALIHFQRKNGLKEGVLDLETLKMLGIKY